MPNPASDSETTVETAANDIAAQLQETHPRPSYKSGASLSKSASKPRIPTYKNIRGRSAGRDADREQRSAARPAGLSSISCAAS